MYGAELEKVEVFNGFQDFLETFNIHRGKVKSKSDEEDTVVGEFKVKQGESPFIFLVICHQCVAPDTFLDTWNWCAFVCLVPTTGKDPVFL